MQVWLNGKSILQVVTNHQKRENELMLTVPIKAGENILTIKAASGKGGFGCWANLAWQGGNSEEKVIQHPYKLYRVPYKCFDPYQFNYW